MEPKRKSFMNNINKAGHSLGMQETLNIVKAVSDPTRLAILWLVFKESELCVCEITHALGVSQPKVSRHLAILKKLGLLKGMRRGQWVYYRLIDGLPTWLYDLFQGVLGPSAVEVDANSEVTLEGALERLQKMGNRPERAGRLCG